MRPSWRQFAASTRGALTLAQGPGGKVYEGIFSAIDRGTITLRMGREVVNGRGGGPERRAERPSEFLLIAFDEWVEVLCKDVRMRAADVGPVGAYPEAGDFATDADISRGRGG